MKKRLFITALIALISNFTFAQEAKTIKEALAISKKENKPVAIEFFADWCSNCKKFEKKTLADSSVQSLLKENFIFLQVDAEKSETDFVTQNKIKSYPQFFVLDGKGKILKKEKGVMSVEEFKKFLTQ